MKQRALLIAAVMLLITAVASVAAAVPPSCDDNPDHPRCTEPTEPPPTSSTTTTETPPDFFWTCQARIDNGAIWNLGEWNGTAYVAGLTSCTDILAEHLVVEDWTVEWSGNNTNANGRIKGLTFVFEEEVNNNVFAEHESTSESDFWCPTLPGGVENMVFLAMQSSGDKWEWFEVTVTPGHIPEVCNPPT